MRHSKLRLLTGTAAGVLSLAVAGQAMAFDEVHWEWNKVIDEYIDKNINITGNFFPTGALELQNLQVYVGDVDATSTVRDIENNPIREGATDSGPQEVTIFGRVSSDGIDPADNNNGGEPNPDIIANVSGESNGGISIDELDGGATVNSLAYFNTQAGSPDNYEIVLSVDPAELTGIALDAVAELPEVESIATAVANNSNVSSDVMVEMHEAQWAWGEFDDNGDNNIGSENVAGIFDEFYNPEGSTDNPSDVGTNSNDYTGNLGVSGALALIAAGAGGFIGVGDVTATSDVDNILNATVDSAATAVANNKSVDLQYVNAGDGVFIGDVTQFAYMNVSSTSDVRDVTINGYSGLGNLQRPIVSSVATSVGNNLSVTVSGPGGASTPSVE